MALAEIADFILNVFQLVNYLLKVSMFIGKVLVQVAVNVSYLVWRCLQAVGQFLVVFYEDYAYFFEDVKRVLSSIAIFFIYCFNAICGGVIKAILTVGQTIVAGYHGVGELLSGRLLTVPIFTFEFLKQLLVLIGNGVWFLVTLPGHIAKNLLDCLYGGLAVVESHSRETGSTCLDLICRLGSFLIKDVPMQSAGGLCVLVLAYLNPKWTKRILGFCYRVLKYIYGKLLPVGRGIRDKVLEIQYNISLFARRTLGVFFGCFVYIRHRAGFIYDTEVHRAITFMRDFFTFSDRRRHHQAAPRTHVSRIEHREQHSSSQSSSRSSSGASQWSDESLANLPENPYNRRSPTKRQDGTTTIGLCIICEDFEKSVVLVPCGHLCLCKRCADQLGNYDRYCPICRTLIYRKVDVYI